MASPGQVEMKQLLRGPRLTWNGPQQGLHTCHAPAQAGIAVRTMHRADAASLPRSTGCTPMLLVAQGQQLSTVRLLVGGSAATSSTEAYWAVHSARSFRMQACLPHWYHGHHLEEKTTQRSLDRIRLGWKEGFAMRGDMSMCRQWVATRKKGNRCLSRDLAPLNVSPVYTTTTSDTKGLLDACGMQLAVGILSRRACGSAEPWGNCYSWLLRSASNSLTPGWCHLCQWQPDEGGYEKKPQVEARLFPRS